VKKIILSLLLIASLLTYSQPKLVGTVHFSGPKYGGSIFRLDLPGTTPGTVYAFNNAVPHRPTGGVIAGNDDWLYGSINYNGVNNNGGFYRIQRNGSNFSMLFNYANSSASSIPIYHADEFLYVMGGNQLKRYDPVGNTVSNLTTNVYSRNLHIDTDDWIYFEGISSLSKIKTDGTSETFLYNFAFPGDGYDAVGVTEVPGNRLFGLHRLGGVNDGGTLYGIEKDGTGFALHHIFTTATGVYPSSKLVYMDGKLFGITNGGGDFGYGTLYSINADGTNFRVLYHFAGGVSGNISISSNARIFGAFAISYQSAFIYYKMFKVDTSGQNFEPFFSIDQRQGGDNNHDILLLNNENIYSVTGEYGKHDGGTFNFCDTSGVGNDLYHFGLSPTGFRPTGGIIKASDGKLYGATVFGGTDGNGIVYSVNTDGTSYTVLHQFTESEGYEPSGKLLEASDGRLYGACRWGGTSLSGFLYRINKNGSGFEVIFEFSGATDGYSPVGSLVEDAAGVLYGTCFYSSTVSGSIFKINKNGTGYSTLRLFSGSGGDLGYPYNGLNLAKGYLYGACGYGGSENNGGLFRIRTDGSGYQVLHDFIAAEGSGSLPVGTPYIASNGKIYGTISFGGTSGEGAIYRIDSVGTNFTILHQFSGYTEGSYPWGGMIQASDGLIYGSTQIGGSGGGGTIFRINLDGSGYTVIKNFDIETDGQGVGSTIIDLNGNFALPVQWVKFTATKKEQSTLLNWQTASEQNSDRFEIERSSNGTIYNSIGTVAATNNPNGAHYSFQDKNPLTGINYYRLRQLDIDGKFEYSRVVQLNFDTKGAITIYPNPVNEWLNISVTGSQTIRSVVITDLNGKIVQTNKNLNTSSIPVRQLNAGAYLIRVETSQGTHVGKFVKQ